jgi:NAD-dependent DNA ligase
MMVRGSETPRSLQLRYAGQLDREVVERAQRGEDFAAEYLLYKYRNLVKTKVKSYFLIGAEKDDLLAFCNLFTSEAIDSGSATLVKSINQGFFQIDPDIYIQEKNFCITGQSNKYKRKEIAEKIELYGGFVTDSVTNSTNYLVVCDEKNDCWAFTCYGKKVEKAINLRKKGNLISIIHEFDLYDALESLGS